VAEVFVQNTI